MKGNHLLAHLRNLAWERMCAGWLTIWLGTMYWIGAKQTLYSKARRHLVGGTLPLGLYITSSGGYVV
jgi:hypothetical protein